MITIPPRYQGFYNVYVLAVLTIGYVLGELGHYMIGVTTKQTAIDLHYGDIACQQNNTEFDQHSIPMKCSKAINETSCLSLAVKGTNYCEWNYNGLGIEYQILAGPTFILVFTIAGVFMGLAADRYHRVKMLTACTFVFAIAIILQSFVKEYWQLVVLRMITAAGESGCNPLATGIMSDIFPESQRALVMAIFNWGIYGGYGISFPVGRYITKANFFGMGWRMCYLGTGVLALIFAILTGTTLKEPERVAIAEMNAGGGATQAKSGSLWSVIKNPAMILLMVSAAIRHSGGMAFAYNADLYYNIYFPDVELGWWLFAVTIVIGSIGVVVGGIVSDKIVAKMGIRSRALVLALSQLISALPAFGSVIFEPLWAMITLGISYFFAEMWFGIVFAIVVEIVPLRVRSSTIGIFLFVMNNVGGNLPIAVDPVAKRLGYREALMIFYAGMYAISSILFFLTCFFLEGKKPEAKNDTALNDTGNTLSASAPTPSKAQEYNRKNDMHGHDNAVFTADVLPSYNSLPHPVISTMNNLNTGSPFYKSPYDDRDEVSSPSSGQENSRL